MNTIKRIWRKVQRLARPFDAQIVKDEPAIVAAVTGLVANVGLDLGFTMPAGLKTAIASLTMLAIGAFTRQSVIPLWGPDDEQSDKPAKSDLVEDDGTYPLSAWARESSTDSVGG